MTHPDFDIEAACTREAFNRMEACWARGDFASAKIAANALIDAAARCRAAVSAEMAGAL